MTMTPPFIGRCLCGATTYRCTAEPLWQSLCHCESCRRATSSPFTSFFGIVNGHWKWTGATPKTYQSSPTATREFCPTCGTQMAYRSTQFPNETHFYAATLDHPEAYTPGSHTHTTEQLPWLHLADTLPRA